MTFGLRLKTLARRRRIKTIIFVLKIRTGVHAEELKVSKDTARIVTGEKEVEEHSFLTSALSYLPVLQQEVPLGNSWRHII